MTARLELVQGDISAAEVDAIVNAWNRNFIPHWLLIPQGVSQALRRRGGHEIFHEVRRHGLLPLGGAVATGAGRLAARWVIHVAALHAYWRASERSVALGARSAFRVAGELGATSLAIPLLGAGTGALSSGRSLELIHAAWREAARPPQRTVVYAFTPGEHAACQEALAALEAAPLSDPPPPG